MFLITRRNGEAQGPRPAAAVSHSPRWPVLVECVRTQALGLHTGFVSVWLPITVSLLSAAPPQARLPGATWSWRTSGPYVLWWQLLAFLAQDAFSIVFLLGGHQRFVSEACCTIPGGGLSGADVQVCVAPQAHTSPLPPDSPWFGLFPAVDCVF